MKTANKFLSTVLSLGLVLAPVSSAGAKDASKETVSPQKARVGTGTTAGQTDRDDDNGLKAGLMVTGIATAALLAVVLELVLDGKGSVATTTTTTTSSGN